MCIHALLPLSNADQLCGEAPLPPKLVGNSQVERTPNARENAEKSAVMRREHKSNDTAILPHITHNRNYTMKMIIIINKTEN